MGEEAEREATEPQMAHRVQTHLHEQKLQLPLKVIVLLLEAEEQVQHLLQSKEQAGVQLLVLEFLLLGAGAEHLNRLDLRLELRAGLEAGGLLLEMVEQALQTKDLLAETHKHFRQTFLVQAEAEHRLLGKTLQRQRVEMAATDLATYFAQALLKLVLGAGAEALSEVGLQARAERGEAATQERQERQVMVKTQQQTLALAAEGLATMGRVIQATAATERVVS
jgi:hypothetical protein